MICELCHAHGCNRTAIYLVRIDKFDWALCYDCSEEERTRGNDKITKTLKNIYWNDVIKRIAEGK